jgi:hypothetical protein
MSETMVECTHAAIYHDAVKAVEKMALDLRTLFRNNQKHYEFFYEYLVHEPRSRHSEYPEQVAAVDAIEKMNTEVFTARDGLHESMFEAMRSKMMELGAHSRDSGEPFERIREDMDEFRRWRSWKCSMLAEN